MPKKYFLIEFFKKLKELLFDLFDIYSFNYFKLAFHFKINKT